MAKTSESKLRANMKWDKANMKVVSFKLSKNNDGDIMEHLDNINMKSEYFRTMVRDDIKNERFPEFLKKE